MKGILNNMLDLTHIEELRSDDLKNMCFYDVPQGEKWKVRLAKEILDVRNKTLDIDNLLRHWMISWEKFSVSVLNFYV